MHSKTMNIIRTVALALVLSSCSTMMPDLSITPISADVQAGGVRETANKEDNMIKVQTGDSATTKYEAEIVDQVYNDIQEYPFWLVWAFAVAMGIAVPSPIAAYSAWSRRRELKAQIKTLTVQLNKQAPLT